VIINLERNHMHYKKLGMGLALNNSDEDKMETVMCFVHPTLGSSQVWLIFFGSTC
jgi:hypothetical protein